MKSYRILTLLAVVGMVSLFANDAMAQRRGGGGGGMMAAMNSLPVTLLGMEEVQKELEFTDEQKKEIGSKAEEMMASFREEMRDASQGGGGMDAVEEMLDKLKEKSGKLVDNLNDDQKKRLKQLGYQRMGMALYSDEAAQKDLGLSDDQVTSIKDAMDGMNEKRREAMQEARDNGGDRESMMEAMNELNEELEKGVMDVLTDKQKESLEEMKGEKFEFPQRNRRGGGRRSDF